MVATSDEWATVRRGDGVLGYVIDSGGCFGRGALWI